MKTAGIVIAIFALVAFWFFFINKRVSAIVVPASDLDVNNLPDTVTFKQKEFKSKGIQGTYSVDGKDLPLYYIFGDASGFLSKQVLGFPKNKYRTSCTGDVSMSDGKYGFYTEDENWCLYSKK